MEIDFLAKLGLSLDEMNGHLRDVKASLMQRKSDEWANYSYRNSGVVPSGGGTIGFLISDPQIGRTLALRQMTIGAPLWVTTAAGQAVIVRSGQNPLGAGASIDSTSVIGYAATLPAVAQWGTQEIPVNPQDNLWCVILNGTASLQYVVSAQYEDYKSGGYKADILL